MDTGFDLGLAAFFAAAAAASALAGFAVLRAYRAAAEGPIKPGPALGACAAAALAAIGLYAWLGSPGASDQPHAPRLAALMAAPPETLGPYEIVAVEEAKAAADPDNPLPPFIIAAVHEQMGDLPAARTAYDLALRRAARIAADPETSAEDRELLLRAQSVAMVRLGEILTMDNGGVAPEEALRLFEAASAVAPANPEPYLHRAFAAARAGAHADALRLWDEALARLSPDSAMRPMAERLRGFAVRGEVPGPAPALPGDAP